MKLPPKEVRVRGRVLTAWKFDDQKHSVTFLLPDAPGGAQIRVSLAAQ
jgi:hypothetical protein